ncbi:sulfite exporter TauE/SafE family protein [Spongiibacter sp. KMU-166]|uniref:Probable membrane transporter protein n=1 Tax=Spongiibacter thalassae TaxID=2721624 RepID=A0ABX1GIG2_9GAMM|nr:sulfite exporter TauE/SafE family protein [Spongiibacter thalassae]NKI18691.1 sulfite exporter TauE/SafE family protein [Spongiibacter thalassae]
MTATDLIIYSSIALSTSTIAAVFGFAGGMILVAALSNLLPAAAVIPVHSAVQLISNSSLAAFGKKFIHWPIVREHLIGASIGIVISFLFLRKLDLAMTPAIIGSYILLSVWSKRFIAVMGKIESFYILGAIQAGLSLIVGATGALQMPALIRKLSNHHQVVSTVAVIITTDHLLKFIVFYAIGFAFIDYAPAILCMGCSAIIGSYVGTKLRHYIDLSKYQWVIKVLLSILAILAISRYVLN